MSALRCSWGLDCPTAIIPRTGNPEHHPWQITNDIIYNAAVWRNGGSGDDTYMCDECLRVGLRLIKLKVDEALGELAPERDKDAEIAELTARLGELQFHCQSVVFEHNRMQRRLADVLPMLADKSGEKTVEMAEYEVKRGPIQNQW